MEIGGGTFDDEFDCMGGPDRDGIKKARTMTKCGRERPAGSSSGEM
jgi:hypothetical protein